MRQPTIQGNATTGTPGQAIDEGKGRIFPCERCGADLKFEIGQQSLQCPFCGWTKSLEIRSDAVVAEQDYAAMLNRLSDLRRKGQAGELGTSEIRCSSCGA